jgi:small conductance mechanosensitive channel
VNIFSQLGHPLADGRLGFNLVATYGTITVTVLGSIIMRRLLTDGGARLARWSRLRWLEAAGEEAARRVRSLLFWLTFGVCLLMAAAGVGYHLAGRDVRVDLREWYYGLSAAELLRLGLGAASLVAVIIGTWLALRAIRRIWPTLQALVSAWLGRAADRPVLGCWFLLLHWYVAMAIRLIAVWVIGSIVGLGGWAGLGCGFLLRVLTILVVARLLTLSCRMLFRALADVGDRHLATGSFRNYWERITLLFPFGERCYEAAVYVFAASLCVSELRFVAAMADYGPKVVQCIGIFFVTRVLVELLQVLLHEAFGLTGEDPPDEQKGRTLVPLLHSVGQYVLYFGSALVMLGVLGISTAPILAGAGIVGLAVGLGAQNLVTDLVSGFFILFESQYLVGDYVKIGDATGVVEVVGIRLTQVRDEHGKLHIIPNGQIKGVVSYSKGYVNAVVDLKLPAGSDLESVFRSMTEAGRRLRAAHHEALADTQILGLVDLGTSDMTVRALTKVRPGTHGAMQNEYRRLLKQVFDQNPLVASRGSLAA